MPTYIAPGSVCVVDHLLCAASLVIICVHVLFRPAQRGGCNPTAASPANASHCKLPPIPPLQTLAAPSRLAGKARILWHARSPLLPILLLLLPRQKGRGATAPSTRGGSCCGAAGAPAPASAPAPQQAAVPNGRLPPPRHSEPFERLHCPPLPPPPSFQCSNNPIAWQARGGRTRPSVPVPCMLPFCKHSTALQVCARAWLVHATATRPQLSPSCLLLCRQHTRLARFPAKRSTSTSRQPARCQA